MGGMLNGIVVVKLGGSLVTRKDIALTPDFRNIRIVAKELADYSSRSERNQCNIFLIHGGGSFGHFYAKRYKLSSHEFRKVDPKGVALTMAAMIDLHCIILKELAKEGVYSVTILTSELLAEDSKSISLFGLRRLNNILERKLVPLSFGNVAISSEGARIISGDEIALRLSQNPGVKKVVFAMDVDGVFPTPEMDTPVIDKISSMRGIRTSARKFDVTGGIGAKTKMGLILARNKAEVFYVNGAKRHRLSAILDGDYNVTCTGIMPK